MYTKLFLDFKIPLRGDKTGSIIVPAPFCASETVRSKLRTNFISRRKSRLSTQYSPLTTCLENQSPHLLDISLRKPQQYQSYNKYLHWNSLSLGKFAEDNISRGIHDEMGSCDTRFYEISKHGACAVITDNVWVVKRYTGVKNQDFHDNVHTPCTGSRTGQGWENL